MISDPTVHVLCDACEEAEVEVELTLLVRQAYDLRNLASGLTRLGWLYLDEDHILCPECRGNYTRSD